MTLSPRIRLRNRSILLFILLSHCLLQPFSVIGICLQKQSCEMLILTAYNRTKLYPVYMGVPECLNVTIHGLLRNNTNECLTEPIVYTTLFECAEDTLNISSAFTSTSVATKPTTRTMETDSEEMIYMERKDKKHQEEGEIESGRRFSTGKKIEEQEEKMLNLSRRNMASAILQLVRSENTVTKKEGHKITKSTPLQQQRRYCGKNSVCCLLYTQTDYHIRNCMKHICLQTGRAGEPAICTK